MSLREGLKRGFKQVKGDVKGFFKGEASAKGTKTGWKDLTGLGRVLSPTADSLGPVKQVIDVFAESISIFEAAANGQKKYDALRERLEKLFEELANHLGSGSPAMTESMESLCKFILKELDAIKMKRERSDWRHYLVARDEEDEILDHYTKIADSLERLSLNANLSIWKIVDQHATEYRSDHMFSLVDRLRPSLSACYNSSEGTGLKRRACTPDTRVNVLGRILDWSGGSEGAVYWLNGMAGTGKTTIAYSVCERLDSEHKLAASFFCSRLRGECREVNLIFPSIAYQLARFSRPFLSALSDTLEQDPDVHTRSLHLQFEGLISKPLSKAERTLPAGLVVVIDALDECNDEDSTRQMLDLLLSGAASLPIRFIVSSRPEPQIRDQMSDKRVQSRLVLHELDTGEVRADIETYLRRELKPMEPSPTEAQIAALVERAGILFIYAATAVRYIGYKNFRNNPAMRLQTILDGSRTGKTKHNEEVDQLYTIILEAALGDQKREEDEKDDMRQVLYTVLCAREPLGVRSLSELLRMRDENRVQAAIQPLYSVLHVVEDKGLVTTLHASFPDFMFDSTRSETYYCDSNAQHHKLAEHCLEYIAEKKPQFNICGLESSYLPDENVPDIERRVASAISSELLYACRYWTNHVNAANCILGVVERIRDFLSTRLLLWMEILSLKKRKKVGVESMRLIVEWCKELKGDQKLAELAQDAKRFVEAFVSNPISRSTPHIYVSMMAFWPKSAPITKHYAKYTRGPVEAEGTALDRRQLAHLSTWAFEKSRGIIGVSPDGQHVAVVFEGGVLVVDSSSGKVVLGPLQGHPNAVTAVGFSPDGVRVLAGSIDSNDPTVLGWDTRSGDVVLGPLQLRGHTESANCLSISPDCSRVVTGSRDKTVYLWDVETGDTLLRLQAQDVVTVVVFSSDGTRIAAGSIETLQVWDIQSGDTILGPVAVIGLGSITLIALSPDNSRIVCAHIFNRVIQVGDVRSDGITFRQIAEHPVQLNCIAFSPDGKNVVSGSDDGATRIWNAQSGRMVLGPLEAHTGIVNSVKFSPDGSRIISACVGGLVCTWDAQLSERSLTSSSTNTLSHRFTCVRFSPDGKHFVSGTEKGTICIWDADTGEIAIGPVQVYTSQISAVDCKNDRVVSGSSDGKMCVCDARSGDVILGPVEVGSSAIKAIAYSPDGKLIATGSSAGVEVWNPQDGSRVLGPLTELPRYILSVQFSPDGTRIVASSEGFSSNIVVWDVSDGGVVFGPFDAHANYVLSVSYSPSGALIASGSADCTVIIWDAYTGKKVIGPFTGHPDWIRSISFSPDGTRFVSGSDDKTIRVWDVQTGDMLFDIPHGHDRWIMSVEYSPDGTRILSCSNDKSVRIHDARSPGERTQLDFEPEVGDWTIDKDGWVVDDQSRLLVWVPGDLRKGLMWPRTQVVLPHAYTRLKFDKSRMGESWARSYTSDI